ncbi:MAG: TIGR02302 family protein [Rhodobacteraceae bacterium]|nr:TIGR02302 family protein [Alphaproteobacteria bacterium]NNF70858.1 TIGR02302 family protein [Paracoccaceae bacterium]NNK66964.1 TIGR02302 family protein [Paracoccaceae bacterium]
MTNETSQLEGAAKRLKWPLRLTLAGMWCERLLRAFWPFVAVLLAVLAALMMGLHETLPLELVWGGTLISVGGLVATLALGVRKFARPTGGEALDRLDRTMPGRPITAIADTQAIGSGDAASEAVWKAHVERMAARLDEAHAVSPDLNLAPRDPFALRYVALLAFVMALLFGSVWRVASITDMAPGGPGQALAAGPAWEGWLEPPSYTGRPSLYLNDIDQASLEIPAGTSVTLRLYGEIGALSVDETVSGRIGELPPGTDPAQDFTVAQDGRLAINGPGGREWDITLLPDAPPTIEPAAALERTVGGEFRQPFIASDDYGVIAGQAEIALDLPRVDRRYGLVADPEPRPAIELDLPMTITGDRREFEETLIDDLAQHPFAGLPVTVTLFAEDAAGQVGESTPSEVILPARRFFDPLASAIIEQRRDLLWSRENAPRIAAVLRAVSHLPEGFFRSETAYLKLRFVIRRLETAYTYASVSTELQEETAQALWDIAISIEEGDLSDALERLRRAQDRLSDAIQNGATDQEIAELMQELRDAMQDYMRQLAEQAGEQGDNQQAENQKGQEITGNQLEEMLQRLQELMEQGRTEEAQALLDQLRQMMENMQIAEGQQGQGQQSPGQQAMEGLAETLRQQQGLSDEAFRDLQEQFGQNGQPGQQPGEGQQQGNEPGEGQGQQPGQGQQQGQGGQQPGQGNQPGSQQSLADRQQALRNELNRQQQNLPGAGTPEGDAARDALDRAGRAMEGAEEALREEDFADALDNQSDAIEALREGMRELGEAMAQQQGQPGQQGDALGEANPLGQRDPLGREAGRNGRLGTDEQLLQGDDVYRRARELLDEIRRRSGEQARPDVELDYLRRLLDRF